MTNLYDNTENFYHKTSLLERCRNAFFSGLLAIEEGFPSFIFTDWINGEWSIFLGPEHLARRALIGNIDAIAAAANWKVFPWRDDWLCEPYSPRQIFQWILDQEKDEFTNERPSTEYSDWLKAFAAKLATESDALPSVSFSNGELIAWLHHRNPDLTTKGIPVERYAVPHPLPRYFEEERRPFILSGPDDLNGGWPYINRAWGVASRSGWTVQSTGISDE